MIQTQAIRSEHPKPLSLLDKAGIAAFDRWIKINPNGGVFKYYDLKLIVTTKVKL